jgi:LacI family transcriptional regulator
MAESESEEGKPVENGDAAPAGRYLTLADVARVAGVHATTVSLALRDHPSIPAETRARIRGVAKELGYRRDPLLDAFNFHRVKNARRPRRLAMAFVVDGTATRFFGPKAYHPLVFDGARAIAEAHNYSIEAFTIGPKDLAPSRLKTILSTRGITGVLLSTFDIDTSSLELDWEHYCTVKIESLHLAPHCDAVSSDQFQAARLAMRRLRESGYHRIGLATAKEDESRLSESFRMGVLVEQASLPEDERVAPLVFALADVRALPSILPEWLRAERVDVIISNWNELLDIFPAAHIRVPEQVAFASLDAQPTTPHVAGVVQNHRLVGIRAMEQLCLMAETHQRGVGGTQSITYVPGFWRDGATTPIRSRTWYP